MKHAINDHLVLLRAPEGPLAAYLGSFAGSLLSQGYAQRSVHRKVRHAACFSRWLKHEGIQRRRIISDHSVQYLQCRAQQSQPCGGEVAALRQLIDFLRHEGVIPPEKVAAPPLTSVERCARAYEQYLREMRGLATATIINYGPFIRSFLQDRFGNGRVTLARLCADDVVGFVQRQAPCLHMKHAKLMTAALRSFLRYARYHGDITRDLAAAVPVVANWSVTSIPRAIAKDQVDQLLASIDRRTAMGRRDHAILLLLARLGLRSGEVALLELDDIDWNTGQLTVRGKCGTHGQLPLPADVGEAIVAYLRCGRPSTTTSRRVFLRAKAPIRGFQGPSGIGSIVRRALQRTGIHAPTCGAHQFRHGLATEMLRQGGSLAEIGELLGHRHPQTTKIYAKVDIDALRTLALPWPGGVQ